VWTPKRIILLAIGFVLFLFVYILYSVTSLGRINTLPPLPDKYKSTASDDSNSSNIDREPHPVQPTPLERKLEMAFPRAREEELKWPVQLELSSKSMVLAAGAYRIEDDGRVLLEPMSLALFGKKKNDGREIEINTLKCKQAYLKFDRRITSLSPSEMTGRKIVEAELFGNPQTPIRITNNRRTTVREDDLEVTITNGPLYYIEKTQIVRTSDHVHLRDGDHTIRDGQLIPPRAIINAQGMEMELATSAPPPRPGVVPAAKPKNESISGVKRIILKEDVDMFLYVAGGTPFPGNKANAERPSPGPHPVPTAASPHPAEPAHIHIVCPGRFEYELFKDHDMARFDVPIDADQATSPQDVTVTRINKQSGNDMLVCKHLEMRLKRRSEGTPSGGAGAAEQGVEIETAHATGPFTTLTSDAEKLEAHGNDFFHDAGKKLTILKGVPYMEAIKEDSVIRAPELHLQEMPVPADSSPAVVARDKKANPPAKTYQQVEATGPGRIDMTNKTTGKPTVHAFWNKKLTSKRDWSDKIVCSHEGMDLLILEGAARFVDDEHDQQLQAETLLVWLLGEEKKPQVPAKAATSAQPPSPMARGRESQGASKSGATSKETGTPAQTRRPHRVEALRNVLAHSAELNIHDTARLVVHFNDVPIERMPPPSSNNGKPGTPPPDNKAAAAHASTSASRPVAPVASGAPVAGGQTPITQGQKPIVAGQQPSAGDKKPASDNRPIDLSANSIEAKVLRCEERMALDHLWAQGGALDNLDKRGGVIVRQEPAKPGEEGVYIEGNTLDMNCTAAGNKLHVTGDLAQLRLDKIFILGPEVNIDQVANKAWVDGQGAMQMQSDKTMDGKPLARPVPLTIHWSQSMLLQGILAEFFGGIQAEQQNALLACQHLQVLFDRPISLKEGMRGDQSAKVDKLVADKDATNQPVRVEDQSIEQASGKLEKYQLMIGRELHMVRIPRDDPQPTGKSNDANKVFLYGPGSVRILQRGDADLTASSGKSTPNQPPPAKPAGQEQEMKLTYITFWSQMQANNQTNVASFWESVRVLSLPCDDPHREIDLDDMLTKELPPGAMYLRCSKTLQVGTIQRNGRTYQWMDALGQVYVQGREFTAQCDHMTFNEEKDQVIFFGENDNRATLSKSVIKGQKPQTFRAKKIIYYRTTGTVDVPSLDSFGG
jgi:hypothetical protein